MISQQGGIKPEETFHGLLGSGVLAIWSDIDPENEEEFNNWYTHQHLPERVGTPGFLRGRRFITPPGLKHRPGAKYFTLYETEAIETLASEPYMLRLNNPTDWTKKMVPLFRNGNRTACRVTASIGEGIGGYIATIEFGPKDDKEGDLREWLRSDAMPKSLEQRPDLTAIHLLEADDATTRAKDQTEESKSAGMRGPLARWVLMVEGMFDAALEAACQGLAAGMAAHGVTDDVTVNRYQLLVSLSE
jgi:hypothetical protein